MTYVTSMHHLEGGGEASGLARQLQQLAMVATAHGVLGHLATNVRCRKRRCGAQIEIDVSPDEILWCCTGCLDDGVIRDFREGIWDLSDVLMPSAGAPAQVLLSHDEHAALQACTARGPAPRVLQLVVFGGSPVGQLVAIEAPSGALDALHRYVFDAEARGMQRRLLDGAAGAISAILRAAGRGRFPAGVAMPVGSLADGEPRINRGPKAAEEDTPEGQVVELAVVASRANAVRCRVLGTQGEVTLRGGHDVAAGEILTVRVKKRWAFRRHPYITGDAIGQRIDATVLGLEPLKLGPVASSDPSARAAAGTDRRCFALEYVLPSSIEESSEPILEAVELMADGEVAEARQVLERLLEKDVRCLDAHAHLGIFELTPWRSSAPSDVADAWIVGRAQRQFEMGVRIAELTLGPIAAFEGRLPWHLDGNRAFLRCFEGLAHCAWRLGRLDDARAIFELLLALNPEDQQGARQHVPRLLRQEPWTSTFGPRGLFTWE